MKKYIKIILFTLLTLVILFLLLFIESFVGNPISKYLARQSAEDCLESNYDESLFIDSVFYDFKENRYHAKIKSKTSIDTHFTLSYDRLGNLKYDNFNTMVTDKHNTFRRIDNEYREEVDKALKLLPYKSDIDFGELITSESSDFLENHGLDIETLEIDKKYDIQKIGESYGKIILYVYEKEVNEENAANILLKIKEVFDKEKVSFYAINLIIHDIKNYETKKWDGTISMESFLYSDIASENLLEKVKENIEITKEYYESVEK